MPSSYVTNRREQAKRELAITDLARSTAAMLVALFLLTVLSVPLVEEWLRHRPDGESADRPALSLAELPSALATAVRTVGSDGLIAADLVLLEAIDRAENRLEDESFLRAWLLPRVQSLLLGPVGLGNEEVYPGRDGWLFYRADVDHVIGPGFLDPRVLRDRARAGDSWQRPPQPDPVVALADLKRVLAARGIDLIVMPTPVKPSVHPERFSERATPARNRSFGDFLVRLRSAEIAVFDPLPVLLAEGRSDAPSYLGTDTHWTPEAMERVATLLEAELSSSFDLGDEVPYLERPATVENRGDLLGMLRLPESQTLVPVERVTVRTVTDGFGASWRPSSTAPILLLGDSFTNVYSDPRLGWGAGAGLAERLSFLLRRPVDRIALNAGGAHASREALARDLDRLAGKKVVVYQFAERELSFGDWRRVEIE